LKEAYNLAFDELVPYYTDLENERISSLKREIEKLEGMINKGKISKDRVEVLMDKNNPESPFK
jgi:uncharacterized small protein (DUF1192 family)